MNSWSQGSSANPAATRQSLAETLMGVGTGNNSGGSGVGVSGANSALDLSEFPALGSPRPDAFPPLSAQIQARSEQFKAALAGHISGFPANTGAPLPRMTMEEFPALPGMALDSQRSNLASHSHTSMGNSNGSIGHIGAAGVSADGSSGHAAAAFSGASSGGSSAHPLSSLVSLNASSATGLGGQSLGGDSSSTTALPGLGRPSTDFPRKNTNSFTELKGGPADHNLSSPLTGNGASGTAVAAAAAAAAVAAVASSSHEPPTSSSNSMQGTGASDLMNGNSGSPNTATQGDGHGLLGLLNTLKTTNHDQSALAFGLDVSKFGLNLSSPGLLYATFTTPWIDQSQANLSHIKPEFSLPSCYQVQPRRPAAERLDRFTEETLFYVFYTMPRDELQVKAAQVLFQRGWRYHKELKLWLTKDPTMGDRAAVVKTPQGEQGIYIFFDPSTWQKVRKEHVLMYDALEDRPALASAVTSSASLSNAPASAAGGAGHLGQQLDPSPLSGAASSASTLSQQNLLAQLQQANLPSHGAGGGLYDSHQTSQTPSSLGLHASSLAHAPGSQLGGSRSSVLAATNPLAATLLGASSLSASVSSPLAASSGLRSANLAASFTQGNNSTNSALAQFLSSGSTSGIGGQQHQQPMDLSSHQLSSLTAGGFSSLNQIPSSGLHDGSTSSMTSMLASGGSAAGRLGLSGQVSSPSASSALSSGAAAFNGLSLGGGSLAGTPQGLNGSGAGHGGNALSGASSAAGMGPTLSSLGPGFNL